LAQGLATRLEAAWDDAFVFAFDGSFA
jgi:hypothetical protein